MVLVKIVVLPVSPILMWEVVAGHAGLGRSSHTAHVQFLALLPGFCFHREA